MFFIDLMGAIIPDYIASYCGAGVNCFNPTYCVQGPFCMDSNNRCIHLDTSE